MDLDSIDLPWFHIRATPNMHPFSCSLIFFISNGIEKFCLLFVYKQARLQGKKKNAIYMQIIFRNRLKLL